MQALIGAPPSANWNTAPESVEDWRVLSAASAGRGLPALRERFGVKTEALSDEAAEHLARIAMDGTLKAALAEISAGEPELAG